MWDQRKYDEEWAVKDALTRKDAALIERLVRERDEWKRRAEATEAQLAIVSGLNEWHDLPELPLLVGHYLAFWREDGAWVAQYWPSGIEDENGNKGNWLTTPDGSIRPNPVAWRHLPSVPEKYAKQGEYFRA